MVKDFLNTCPLIAALRHPSMRPRHWTMLMQATKKQFVPPHENPSMKLAELLSLNLHEFTMDVEEITDQAQKEEKMEQTLQRLAAAWQSVQFLLEEHKGSGVQLIKMAEEDFEALENDQLAVQTMMASRFLATFQEVRALRCRGAGRALTCRARRAWLCRR